MDDAKYVYYQHQRELKNVARNAKYRRVGARPRKAMMPSDNLTQKQRKGLNGKVESYNMDVSHTWDEIKDWPEDIQNQYLHAVVDKYKPRTMDIMADMLHVGPKKWREIRDKYKIELSNNWRTDEEKLKWKEFVASKIHTVKQEDPKPEPKNEPAAKPAPAFAAPPMYFGDVNITKTGKPLLIFNVISSLLLDPNCEYEFEIHAKKKGEESNGRLFISDLPTEIHATKYQEVTAENDCPCNW